MDRSNAAKRVTLLTTWLPLMVGSIALFFANGRWVVPVAAWLYVLFMVRFVRQQSPLRGFLVLALVEMVVNTLAWWGTTSASFGPLQLVPAGLGIAIALAFLADRLLAPRLGGLAGTLVLPLAYTLLEWLIALLSPLGSIGMLAYTQFDNLPLIQVVSLTGTAGLTFLIVWFGSVANLAWERGCSWPDIRRAVLAYAAVLAFVLAYGGVRLALAPRPQGTVRIAGINQYGRPEQRQMIALWENDRAAYQRLEAQIEEDALSATRREAEAGAQVVLWQESAIHIAEDPAPFVARAAEVARQAHIYLVVPLYVTYPETHGVDENKLLILDPAGNVVLQHGKFGSASLEGIRRGDSILRTVQTPWATISAVICRDLDFPAVIRQAGRNGTDVLLAPSFDWYEIDPFHTRYAIFRAVEDGFSLVRQVAAGLSVATDPYGRVVASMDAFNGGEQTMVAQVPAHGVLTLYAYAGDWFDVLVALGLAVAIWQGLRRPRKA